MGEVKFKNGKTVEADVYGASMFYQDAQRQTLEIVFSESSMSFEEAKEVWKSSDDTSEITVTSVITDENGKSQTVVSVQPDYSIPVELKCVQIGDVFKLRMKLAQKTTIERKQEELMNVQMKQAQDIDDANVALCELATLTAELSAQTSTNSNSEDVSEDKDLTGGDE